MQEATEECYCCCTEVRGEKNEKTVMGGERLQEDGTYTMAAERLI